jgi:hypothetical protein
MTVSRNVGAWLIGVAALALMPAAAFADTVTVSFLPTNTFSGTAPSGTLTAQFSDVAGGVQLVITSSLASGENLDPGKALYLNINPSKSFMLPDLSFALTGNTGFSQAASVQTGEDAFKADGTGGNYDIQFTYGSSTKAFTTGESQTYLITTSVGTISADDFNYLSTGGSPTPFLAAIHVQNTPSGGQGSGWVGGTPDPVPVPPSLVLALTGIGSLGLTRLVRWRRSCSASL